MKCFNQKLKTFVFSKEISGKNEKEALQTFIEMLDEYKSWQLFDIRKTGA